MKRYLISKGSISKYANEKNIEDMISRGWKKEKEISEISQEKTITLATMSLAELKKEAERLGVKIEGKLTNENKGEVIKALIKKQGQ